ncbi:MAG: SGNH/GDSL hydrolase family protein [Coxiellaceae bacterium]|nr:SGNH/GDSL hydrolase family protein [Coxiellaceae bacterium]
MKKIILTIAALFFTQLACAHFSNMIVFGDSLSDVGNFPESPRIYWDESKPKNLFNAIAQFYVPFANPVDTRTKNTGNFPWPTLNSQYLAPQTTINGKKRMYRSIGWTAFFLSLANYKNKTTADIISPSYLLATRNIPSTISFNYAWGYATSFADCVNPQYQHKNCNQTSILNARKNYTRNPSSDNYKNIEVPGLSTQVRLFLADKHNKKVSVDRNTLYAIWIGGNDLIVAGNAIQRHNNPLPTFEIMLGETSFHIIQSITLLLKHLPDEKKPEKIYVFTVFNPGLSPAFYKVPIAKFGNFVVKSSNFFLKVYSGIFNVFSSTKIIIVPTYEWYQAAADSTQFKNTLGKSCQLSAGNYDNVQKIPSANCKDYLFWNDVHPATPMQAIVAKRFFQWIGL